MTACGCGMLRRFIVVVSDVSARRVERCLIENVRHVSSNLILRHVSSNLIYLLRTYASFCLHLFDRMKSYAVGLDTLVRVNLTLIAQVFQDRDPVYISHLINPVNTKKRHIECFDTCMEY